MQEIPLKQVPNQTLSALLDGQQTKLRIYTSIDSNLYMDVYVNDVLIIGGVICQDRNRIVRDSYLGLSGDLAFIDTQGTSDPTYSGLGSRFILAFLTASEVAAL